MGGSERTGRVLPALGSACRLAARAAGCCPRGLFARGLRSSMQEQVRLAALPAAADDRGGLQDAALASWGYKLLRLRIQVRKVASERDKARLDLERAERRCLRLGRAVDEQHVALEHTQSRLKDFQAELEAKEQLLQEAVSHQVKLEAEAQFLQGKEASLQGRLNHTMKENSELQNKVTEMAEKLAASEQLVLELQRELSWLVKDKVLWEQNGVLHRELQRLQESRAGRELPAAETSPPVEQFQEQLQELKVELETKRAEVATKLEQPQQHAAWRREVQLLHQQLRALQEELSEAKASLSLAQTQHALQLQQAKAQMNNMVPKKQFEQLQNSLREEQCKAQHLQEDLSQQAQQAHRQLVRTQAQLSRNKLLIEDLQEENRRFAAALQAAELKQRSTEERNQLLEEQASALKQLIGTITPASLSG
ncbi:ninein-like protein [Dryobates pubescens]|uniref:ninein-like protein n=1 Tax=Dryobates pubescens TaxID=118200 RepID=UPI0023B90C1B|nr:ninein-like protein [Dryobates pubescens]